MSGRRRTDHPGRRSTDLTAHQIRRLFRVFMAWCVFVTVSLAVVVGWQRHETNAQFHQVTRSRVKACAELNRRLEHIGSSLSDVLGKTDHAAELRQLLKPFLDALQPDPKDCRTIAKESP